MGREKGGEWGGKKMVGRRGWVEALESRWWGGTSGRGNGEKTVGGDLWDRKWEDGGRPRRRRVRGMGKDLGEKE